MTLSQLALRNVKRNFKNYFLYFFSMIFSIAIYYTFKSIEFNSQLIKAAEGSRKISSAFTASSVLLILFVAIFIIYSNSFFTKKRKKEVGLYSLLGVQKKQIAKMLFYENLLMGLIALVVGIGIGSLLSKGAIGLLLSLMGMDMSISFEIPMKAVLYTAATFFVIILYTSFQGYRLIYRFKLIELFHAEKEGEKIPKGSPFFALIGVAMIAGGYYVAYNFLYFAKTLVMMTPLLILFLTVGGSYILFHFFTVFVLRRLRNRKGHFYNGMNMVSTSQLLYRIKGNATSLATIATLSAVTIVAIGVSVALYFNVGLMADSTHPYSYSYQVVDEKSNKEIDGVLEKHKKENSVKKDFSLTVLEAKGMTHGKGEKKEFSMIGDGSVSVISKSMYDTFAKEFGYEKVEVKGTESVQLTAQFLIDAKKDFGEFMNFKNDEATFKVGKETITITSQKEIGAPISNAFGESIVVSDETYNKLRPGNKEVKQRLLVVDNQRDSESLTKEMQNIATAKGLGLYDHYSTYKSGLEGSGIMIFIGTFLGIVFLLATGSIIYFKQLSEATEDKDKYEVLRKIGVTKKEMKRAIAKQIGFIFATPLIIASLHSFFALNTAKTLFMLTNISPILWATLAYIIIYIGYYVLTVRSYVGAIKK